MSQDPVFADEAQLDERLTAPPAPLAGDLRGWRGDIVVLGAGGKMGPTLCRLARRGLDAAGRAGDRVFAVSRWSDPAAAEKLREHKVEVVPFDLLGEAGLAGLPDASGVILAAGAKFGTAARPDLAWAVNTALPDRVARRYPRARIVALSTGNVYPYVPVASGGCRESDEVGPVGEYAMSCLGRERILGHAAAARGTAVALLRLNYAIDLRYGVLADIGQAVLAGQPVDVRTPAVNVVWQGYACQVVLRAIGHASPEPFTLNLTGPETASVRRVATRFAERFGVEPAFDGQEGPTALLSDATRCHRLFGYPDVPLGTLIDWQAGWLAAGLPTLGKPTKFATRDGAF